MKGFAFCCEQLKIIQEFEEGQMSRTQVAVKMFVPLPTLSNKVARCMKVDPKYRVSEKNPTISNANSNQTNSLIKSVF